MLTTGNQIKAARALLDWTQKDLATAAALHSNAIAYWEDKPVIHHNRRHTNTGPSRIVRALESAGVAFIREPGAGVCLVPAAQNVCAVKETATLPITATNIGATYGRLDRLLAAG